MTDATRGAQWVAAVDGTVTGPGDAHGVHGPAGLPVAVSILVGREQERVEVAELVAETRLVTLTGSGGCGKTRLALEVAHDVAPGFEHGACWVELSGVGDPGSVAQALADAAGVREEPGRALVDTLLDKLGAWRGLVVLDNCEHVVGACATLVGELLRSCPLLTVLSTSREPLAIDGETTWEVPPLPVPDKHVRSVDAVVAADAVALFETRARQVRPDFVLTDHNAAAVAEICRRLDGIPLAVELAAARVRVLSVEQVAAGLSDRFRLLTGTVRGAPSRQHTLEASVAWSFGLLADAERLALARLSVFAGSFDLEAAEAVVAGSDIDETDVLDLVGALADVAADLDERDAPLGNSTANPSLRHTEPLSRRGHIQEAVRVRHLAQLTVETRPFGRRPARRRRGCRPSVALLEVVGSVVGHGRVTLPLPNAQMLAALSQGSCTPDAQTVTAQPLRSPPLLG